MADPALTIVIAVLERPGQFIATLDSVAQQTMPDVEVIAVVAPHLFQSVKDQLFKRKTIRHYVAEPGIAAGGLLRKGTDAARAPLVAWVMGDFVLDPRRLEAQAEALRRTGADFATCGIRGMSDSGWLEPAPASVASDMVAMLRALIQGKISPTTIVAKRRSLEAVGGFDPDYECMFELDVAVRMALRYSAAHVPVNLIRSVPFRGDRPEREPETRRVGESLIHEGASSGVFDNLKSLGGIVSAFDPQTRPLGAAAAYLAKRLGPADLAIGVLSSADRDLRSLAAQMGVPDARIVMLPATSPLRAISEVLSSSDAERIVVLPADAPPPSPEAFAAQVLHAAEQGLDACLPIVDSLVYEVGPAASAIPGTLFARSALEKGPLRLARTELQFWALFSSASRVGGMPPAHPVQRPDKRFASTRLLSRPSLRIAPEDLIVALVDPDWYLALNPDVAALNVDAVDHFLNTGWRERRNPNPWFHTAWYLGKNPDVLARNINPLQHFVLEGAAAGLQPSPGFDIAWYSRYYLDADQPFAEALLHFMTVGLSVGSVPFPRLHASKALAKRPDFLLFERNEPERPDDDETLLQALVDADSYRASYAPGQGPLFSAAADYFEQGWRLGYNPNPWFDTRWYLSQNPGARAAKVNPLVHFVKSGARLGRRPHPFFDLEWYTGHYLGGIEPSAEALRHFLAIGLFVGAVPHPRIASPAVKKRLLETPPNARSALIKRLHALVVETGASGELPLSSDQDLWPLAMAEELPEGVLPVLLICGPWPESWDRARAAAYALPIEEYALFGVAENEYLLRLATSLENGAVSLRLRVPEQGEMLRTLLTTLNCRRAVAVDARLAGSPAARAVRSAGVPLFENGPGRRRRSNAARLQVCERLN
jgi:hypothetical protein